MLAMIDGDNCAFFSQCTENDDDNAGDNDDNDNLPPYQKCYNATELLSNITIRFHTQTPHSGL